MRVIIDTDPGIDDSVALALAARSPELEIVAVTTTYGNTTVGRATRNARELFARLGVQERIPLHTGAACPLLRPLCVASDTHGEQGLGYAALACDVTPEALTMEAPGAMLNAVASSPTPLTLICLGPLTNLAIALFLDRPLLQERIGEVVIMGGEPDGRGNITPVSEFNFWCDPEAAQVVLHSGLPLRMVGLNVTRHMVLTRRAIDLLSDHHDPALRWWGDMLRFYEEFHRSQTGLEGCIVNDPLAVALAMLPELGTARPMYVDIARHDDATRGQSLCDRDGLLGRDPNAAVYLSCRWADALQLVNDRVFGGALPANEIARGAAQDM